MRTLMRQESHSHCIGWEMRTHESPFACTSIMVCSPKFSETWPRLFRNCHPLTRFIAKPCGARHAISLGRSIMRQPIHNSCSRHPDDASIEGNPWGDCADYTTPLYGSVAAAVHHGLRALSWLRWTGP